MAICHLSTKRFERYFYAEDSKMLFFVIFGAVQLPAWQINPGLFLRGTFEINLDKPFRDPL